MFVMSEYSGRPVGSGELPQVQLGDVYQCIIAAQQASRWHTFCRDSFYWFKGADKLERQYCKMRFGFVSTALAGARTVALYTHIRVTSLRAH